MADRREFGRLPDGGVVEEVTIAAGDLVAKVINLGAVIRDVRLAGVAYPLVLGFDNLDSYLAHSPHFGAVAGRCANRIGGGRLVIDGKLHELPLNEGGHTHLHGGRNGFGHRLWRIVSQNASSVTLAIDSEDGDAGYPGNMRATCRYVIDPPGTIRFEAEAVADKPTIVNLAQHSYFNLDDSADILDHEVQIFADAYTPLDSHKVPTGEIRSVAGTPYDFRKPRPIRLMQDGQPFAYDINFVVAMDKTAKPRPQAHVRSPKSGIVLDVASTEPGVQFYDAAPMKVPAPGLDGRRYGARAGFCFEPQFFPDSPNHANFPDAILRPGTTYRQTTTFAFSRS